MDETKKNDNLFEENTQLISDLKSLSFFSNFPDQLLGHLAALTKLEQFSQGELILEQGQVNDSLYFLLSGEVGVYVDDGRVASLHQQGDLIGEMSVISSRPVTATIRAESDVELLSINAKEFSEISGADSDKLQHSLYRIYSMILTEKLRLTNEKAKYYEKTSQELERAREELEQANVVLEKKVAKRTEALRNKTADLEQQHAEVLASHKKLEELYSSKEVTFKKLEKLYKDHLLPLRFTLGNLEDQVEESAVQTSIREAGDEVGEVIHLLEPITSLYSSELAMRSKKVLLAESNKKQQVVAKMALGGTGVELDIVSDFESAEAEINQKVYDIVLFDASMMDLLKIVPERSPGTKMVLMTSEPISSYVAVLKQYGGLPNIVSRDANDRTFTIKNIMTTITKLLSSEVFGLEKYLTWGVDIVEHTVTSSKQRTELIDQMTSHFAGLGVRRSNRERCVTVTEEILMNAIYDAPVDGDGRSLYNHMPRTEVVNLKQNEYSKLRYAMDGMLMAVSVEDPFGALTGETVLKYLESCYGDSAGKYNKEKGGAGRGLHQIVENSDLVVFNIRPREKTEVIALFHVDPKDANEYPSFHFFIN